MSHKSLFRVRLWNNKTCMRSTSCHHDDVIKWIHFPRYLPFVWGIHRSPVNSPHKGQWRGALMFSLISARANDWINNRNAGDLRRHRAHYDVNVMMLWAYICSPRWGESGVHNGDAMSRFFLPGWSPTLLCIPHNRRRYPSTHTCECANTVTPVSNDHLMGYFSAFWSSSRWPLAT